MSEIDLGYYPWYIKFDNNFLVCHSLNVLGLKPKNNQFNPISKQNWDTLWTSQVSIKWAWNKIEAIYSSIELMIKLKSIKELSWRSLESLNNIK